jgi:1,2-phenylacetyl-CoA epoxidase catalytic subunit
MSRQRGRYGDGFGSRSQQYFVPGQDDDDDDDLSYDRARSAQRYARAYRWQQQQQRQQQDPYERAKQDAIALNQQHIAHLYALIERLKQQQQQQQQRFSGVPPAYAAEIDRRFAVTASYLAKHSEALEHFGRGIEANSKDIQALHLAKSG